MTSHIESKRIKQFRLEIAKNIPKFPNNRQTLSILEGKSLPSLLVDHINWAYRLIPQRPRKIKIEPTLTADTRWKVFAVETKKLLKRASQGENLNSHLSLRAFRNGFTPASSLISPSTDKWEDKDFLLNIMGYHHFHLSHEIEKTGHTRRTDVVLFAQVTRSEFIAIALFDHSVFEHTAGATIPMTKERERLWALYDKRNSIGREPGKAYISNLVTTSGHSYHHKRLAYDLSHIIYTIDNKLESLSTRHEIFNDLSNETVKAMKLSWQLRFLDLGLLDKTTSIFYILKYGST
jgi:hypothetical protein